MRTLYLYKNTDSVAIEYTEGLGYSMGNESSVVKVFKEVKDEDFLIVRDIAPSYKRRDRLIGGLWKQ